jgi:DNA-binding beta-propeller fold protein YncE
MLFNILLTVNLYADVMQKTIHFQGFLTDSNDVAVMDNVYTMTFSLWDNSDNENPIAKKLWEETQQISVSRGIYSTNLGETSPFPYTLNFSQQYYLGVQVGDESIMKINGSLIPIVSTWHAFRSDTAGGRNVKTINANYLLDKTDDIILTTGTIMINLRSAADIPEKWYTIKKMDDESTTVSIHTSSGELINDRTSWEISKQFTDLSIISNGLQWFSVGVSEISGITTTQLSDNAVTSAKIIDGTITGSDIQNSAVDTTQLADNAITSDKISDATITSADLADSSILPTKLSGNPGNGNNGSILISKGDGTFDWRESGGVFDTTPGVSASLEYSIACTAPFDVAVDNSGKVYVLQSNGYIMVYKASGEFSYSIGTGEYSNTIGSFKYPFSVDVDNNGKIYVSELNGHRVQVFTADGNYSYSIGTGAVNTSLEGFYSPSGIAIDNNGKIYVSDTRQNSRIMVFTASGSYDYSINAPIRWSNDLFVDNNGNIYLSDDNNCVHVFASGSYSYSFGSAGNSPGEFTTPHDVALDSNGNIYVSEKNNHRVQVFTASGDYDYSITHNDLMLPQGICVHNSKIYIVSASKNKILVFNPPSPTYHSVESAYIGIGTATPTETLEVDGNIKINNNLILSTGTSSDSQTVLKAMTQSEARTINLPDTSGIVVVTDDGNVSIPDGAVTASKLAGNPGNGTVGETLVSKGDGTFTWETPESTFLTTLASAENIAYSIGSNSGSGSDPGQFNYPTNVTLDNNGSIYVTDASNRRIQVFTSSGDYSYSIVTGHGSNGLALDSKGNIYVNDEGNHRVRVFTAAGDYSYSIGTGSSGNAAGQFNNPSGIAVDSNDNIYVSDALNSRIQVFTAQGNYSYSFNAGFITSGITLDSSGNIYVSDNNNHCIQVFTAQGINKNTIGSAGSGTGQLDFPFGMDIDSSGNIYVAEMNNNRVQVFTASGTYSYSIGQLNRPFGVATDNSKIYVADKDNHRIMVYNIQQTTHTVSTGNVGIGTTSPTEKLEVDGNIKINNDLILSTGSSSVSQTVLKTMSQSEARTITLPDTSGIVVVTDDGNINIPDGSITASKLANNPGNGTAGETLVSKGDGTFDWGQSGLVTSQGSSAGFDYSLVSDAVNFSDELYDVELDSSGKIYVSDSIKHCIYVFTSTGTFDYSIGNGPGSANGQFYTPYGLTVDSNDKIYVADNGNNRIQVFTASGDYEYSIVNIDDPGDVAVDKNGKIYVTQETSFQVLTASGNFDYSIGKDTKGTGQGEFDFAFGIDVDSDGKIYVADVGNYRIQVFTASGVYDYSIPHWFGLGFGGYYDVALDNSGKIYVSDSSQGRFVVYTAEGNLDYSILVNDTLFNTGIDVDNNGRVYLVGSPWFFSTETESRVSIFNIPSDTTHTIENGNVGIGTSSPTETLEVNGTVKINNALKLEPMSSPPTNASEGTLYYDSDDHKLKVYNGTNWQDCF